jgi:IS5 family transposase
LRTLQRLPSSLPPHCRQTINDNLRWFTPAVLDQINQIVVNGGMKEIGVSKEEAAHARCDSFVVETDVHFSTDINLLWNATRKASVLGHRVAMAMGIDGRRQAQHNLRNVKRLFRTVQTGRDRDKFSDQYMRSTQRYIDEAMVILDRASPVAQAAIADPLWMSTGMEIQRFVARRHACRTELRS